MKDYTIAIVAIVLSVVGGLAYINGYETVAGVAALVLGVSLIRASVRLYRDIVAWERQQV